MRDPLWVCVVGPRERLGQQSGVLRPKVSNNVSVLGGPGDTDEAARDRAPTW